MDQIQTQCISQAIKRLIQGFKQEPSQSAPLLDQTAAAGDEYLA